MAKTISKLEIHFVTINFNSFEDMTSFETEFDKAIKKLQESK